MEKSAGMLVILLCWNIRYTYYCAVVAMFGSVFVPCFVMFSIMASFSDLYMLVDILLPLFARSTAGLSLTQFMYSDF